MLHKFPLGHFFSTIPSDDDVDYAIEKRAKQLSHPTSDATGIRLRASEQLCNLRTIARFVPKVDFPLHPSPSHYYYFLNQSFSFSDAIVYSCMIRHLRPKRVVEIGAGFSTAVAVDTIQAAQFDHACEIVAVDPFPRPLVQRLVRDRQITLLSQPVQQAPSSLWQSLVANDILFVDSTHVMKAGSDLQTILFEILPLLAKGVYVHFHDVFWPWEYPTAWLRARNNWNELYVLRAFLQYNQVFVITIFLDYLWHEHSELLRTLIPKGQANPGGGLWLQKTC